MNKLEVEMAQFNNTKTGDLICPLCGGKVIHTKFSAQDSWKKTPRFDLGWICTECGSEFSAEIKGGQTVFKEITIQERVHEIDILGNIEGRIL